MTPSHRIALSDPRACKAAFGEFNHLTMREVAEYERLDQHLQAHGRLPRKMAPRYAALVSRKYFAPVVSEAPGAVA